MLPHPVCPPDEVHYCIYTGGPHEALEAQCNAARSWLATVFPFLRSYVWQRDAFELAPGTDRDGPACLTGQACFGDNVADEWFMVFLLAELSRHFEGWVVSVSDDDGQLLLIEAAPELPDWLEPDTCENRVFLYRGQLHIIPFPSDGAPGLAQALDWVRSREQDTLAPPRVRDCIERRLACFPHTALISNHHRCRVLLPEAVAVVLQQRPQLVARAVTAFYYREPREAGRVLRHMARFDPAAACTLRLVRFTRCLFAQLLHQRFAPPSQRFVLPAPTDPLHKAATLGMKLTCGFELLCAADAAVAADVDELLRGPRAPLQDDVAPERMYDDDEGWMLVSPADVNDLLATKESEVAAELDKAADWVQTFVGHRSGLEGAEAPKGDADHDAAPSLDVERFLRALQHGLDLAEAAADDGADDVMDEELAGHAALSGDFERHDGAEVDVELNLVTNVLRGLEAAQGEPGPMTNLLGQQQEQQQEQRGDE